MQSAVAFTIQFQLRSVQVKGVKVRASSIRPHQDVHLNSPTYDPVYPCTRKCMSSGHAFTRVSCIGNRDSGLKSTQGTAKIPCPGRLPRPAPRSFPLSPGQDLPDKNQRPVRGRGRGQARDQASRKGVEVRPGHRKAQDSALHTLDGIHDLAILADVIQQHAAAWSAEGRVHTMLRAFGLLAKLGGRRGSNRTLCQSAFRALAESYMLLSPELLNAHALAYPLWACAKLSAWDSRLPAAMLAGLTEAPPGAAAEADTATRAGPSGNFLQRRRQREGLLHRATNRSHANIWWAVSRAPHDVVVLAEEALRESTASLLRQPAVRLGPQLCSNVLLACSRLNRRDEVLMMHMATCLVGKSARDSARGRARTEGGVKEESEDQGEEEAGQEAGEDGADEAARDRRQPGCNGQDLSNALYALSVLGCGGGPLASVVEELCAAVQLHLRHRPASFSPQGLANIIWALEGLRPRAAKSLTKLLAQECRRRAFAGFVAQDFSTTAWALAKMGWSDSDWYTAFVESVTRPGAMDEANQQAWANVWHALAMVRHRPLRSMVDCATLRHPGVGALAQLSPLDILRRTADAHTCCNMLWSLAVLSIDDERLVDVLAERLGELLRQEGAKVSGTQLTCSAWALAVLGPDVLSHHATLVEALLWEAANRWEEQEASAGAATGAALGATADAANGSSGRVTGGGGSADSIDTGIGADVGGGFGFLGPECLMQLWQAHQELLQVGRGQQLATRLEPGSAMVAAVRRSARSESSTSRTHRHVLGSLRRLQRRLAGVGTRGRAEVPGAECNSTSSMDGGDMDGGDSHGGSGSGGGGRDAISISCGGIAVSISYGGVAVSISCGGAAISIGGGGAAISISDGGAAISISSGAGRGGINNCSAEHCGASGRCSNASSSRGPEGCADRDVTIGEGVNRDSHGCSSYYSSTDIDRRRTGSIPEGSASSSSGSGSTNSTGCGDRGASAAPLVAALGGGGAIRALFEEHFVEVMFARVDVVVQLEGGRKVALEVDGPLHYMSNEPYLSVKTGATWLRDRQLQRVFGESNVLTVPYWEWDELRDEGERHAYLCRLLGLPVPEP